MLLATMLNPTTMVTSAVLAVAWFVVIRATAEGSAKIGFITITRKNASLIMMIISGVVAFFMVKSVFFVTLGSGSALALIHAFFRESSKQNLDDNQQPLEEEYV
jgi:hypothetical protein|eukprot:scaffold171_cov284-Chaetoceros_neogracile.AAC.9